MKPGQSIATNADLYCVGSAHWNIGQISQIIMINPKIPSRIPKGTIPREVIAPCTSRTFSISGDVAVSPGGIMNDPESNVVVN